MARDSSGVYTLPLTPVAPDEVISSTWMNSTLTDIAQALTDSIPADGSRGLTSSFKLLDGTAAHPGLTFNSESSTGLFRPTPIALAISVGGFERARWHDGNLLLGTTVDNGKRLQVAGDAEVFGDINNVNSNVSGTLTVLGTSVQHGDIDARGNIGADGIIFSVLDLAANGNCSVGGNLWGRRALVAAGTAAEPSFGLQSQITGMYFPTSSSIALITGASETAKFETDLTTVSSRLKVKGATAAYSGITVGADRPDDSASFLDLITTSAGTQDFRLIRGTGANGAVQFIQNGTGRMQFQSGASEYRYTTTSNTTSNNYTAATTSADNGAYCTALTAAGTYQLMFKNAALSQSLTPYQITRSATGGISAQIFRVGGDITTSAGSLETFRITDNNRFLIGNANDAIYSTDATDVSTNYYFHGAKLGGGSAVISMGSESSSDANLSFSRNNANSKRVIHGQVVGSQTSGVAGAEAGQLSFRTKDAADAATVTRLTINGSGATFAVPISGKAFVNTAITQTLFSGASDITADYPLMVSKSGGGATTTGVALGSNNADRSTIVFNQLNTASTRLVGSRIVGMNSSNTAGAEKGYLVFDTKAAADVSPVTRLTLSETAAAFAVPVTASNLSYNTKVVAGALTQDGIFSTAAGFTLNTSDLATGKIFQVYNNSAASITITQGAGVTMRLVGTATTGNRTVAQRGLATITCISATEVVVEGAT